MSLSSSKNNKAGIINRSFEFAGAKQTLKKEELTGQVDGVLLSDLLGDQEIYEKFQSGSSGIYNNFLASHAKTVGDTTVPCGNTVVIRELFKNSISVNLKLNSMADLTMNLLSNHLPKVNADFFNTRMGASVEWRIVSILLTQDESYFKRSRQIVELQPGQAIPLWNQRKETDNVKKSYLVSLKTYESLDESTLSLVQRKWNRRWRQLKRVLRFDNEGKFEIRVRKQGKQGKREKTRDADWTHFIAEEFRDFDGKFGSGTKATMPQSIALECYDKILQNIAVRKCEASPFNYEFGVCAVTDTKVIKMQKEVVRKVVVTFQRLGKAKIPAWLTSRMNNEKVTLSRALKNLRNGKSEAKTPTRPNKKGGSKRKAAVSKTFSRRTKRVKKAESVQKKSPQQTPSVFTFDLEELGV